MYHKIDGRIIAEIRNRPAINAIKILFCVLFLVVNFAFRFDFFALIIDISNVVIFLDIFVIVFDSIDDVVAVVGIKEIMRSISYVVIVEVGVVVVVVEVDFLVVVLVVVVLLLVLEDIIEVEVVIAKVEVVVE